MVKKSADHRLVDFSLVVKHNLGHAEQRMRIHLRKRHKIKAWEIGYAKFPSRDLYERHGLYKLPKVPGWKTVHASV
jgi:RNA-directed DNA polymerase